MPTIDLQKVWRYTLRVSGVHERLAEFCGVDPRDPQFTELLRSMAVSGFLVPGFGRYEAGKCPPDGPGSRVVIGSPSPDTTGAAAPVRPGPVGVIPGIAAEPAAPAAGEDRPAPPDGFRYASPAGGALEVVDDRTDRIAKAEMIPALTELANKAQFYRQAWENDDLPEDEDADTVVEKLLDAIDKMAQEVGYGVVGDVDDEQPYDPEKHQYCGTLPPTGMTAEVWLTTTGRTWTHRGVTHVLQKAYVDLVDDDRGSFSINKAGDLDAEGQDPRCYLWFDDNSPEKPETYKPNQYNTDGGDWYRATKTCQSSELNADCEAGECDHVKNGDGACDAMLFLFEGADDYMAIPYQQLVTSQGGAED